MEDVTPPVSTGKARRVLKLASKARPLKIAGSAAEKVVRPIDDRLAESDNAVVRKLSYGTAAVSGGLSKGLDAASVAGVATVAFNAIPVGGTVANGAVTATAGATGAALGAVDGAKKRRELFAGKAAAATERQMG